MAMLDPVTLVLAARTIEIRSCRVEEAEALIEFNRSQSGWEFSTAEPEEFSADLDAVRGDLGRIAREPGLLRLVALHQGRIVGGLDFASPSRKRIRHRGKFGIAIAQEYRGAGIGTALIRAMLAWAKDHPTLEKVRLSVLSVNVRAIRLYERLGFEEEGRRMAECHLPRHGYVDEVMMATWVKCRREG